MIHGINIERFSGYRDKGFYTYRCECGHRIMMSWGIAPNGGLFTESSDTLGDCISWTELMTRLDGYVTAHRMMEGAR